MLSLHYDSTFFIFKELSLSLRQNEPTATNIDIMKIKKSALFLSLLIITLFTACDFSTFYKEDVDTGGGYWHKDETFNFPVRVTDTLKPYHVFINLEHTETYPYSNLWLFVDAEFQSGTFFRDTIEIPLADQTGKWYGGGMFDTKSIQVPYKINVGFPRSGKYEFRFTQGMRIDSVPVTQVGLEIVEAKE